MADPDPEMGGGGGGGEGGGLGVTGLKKFFFRPFRALVSFCLEVRGDPPLDLLLINELTKS